ncbi:MAG: GGDEF domain-containing protein [Candidatus Anstonellales archaeon]
MHRLEKVIQFKQNYEHSSNFKKFIYSVFYPLMKRDMKLVSPLLENINKLKDTLMLDQKFGHLKVHNYEMLKQLFHDEHNRYNGRRSIDLFSEPSSFIMLDIDNFKVINSKLTHQGGDIVLEELIKIIKNSVREQDILIRFGGEEFIIYLPYTNLSYTHTIAERIRKNVEAHLLQNTKIRMQKEKKLWEQQLTLINTFTFSFTITLACVEILGYTSLKELLKQLSELLLLGKEQGKNQVVVDKNKLIK